MLREAFSFRSSASEISSRNLLEDKKEGPQMASAVFSEMMKTELHVAGYHAPHTPLVHVPYLEDVQDAFDSLHMGPEMIERVFKHAQKAIHSASLSAQGFAALPRHAKSAEVPDGMFSKDVGLPYPDRPFSLRHALGISSDAPYVLYLNSWFCFECTSIFCAIACVLTMKSCVMSHNVIEIIECHIFNYEDR
jgi:hypothetical protein